MSPLDEARALLAANDDSFATLDVERRLLAALCDEVAALREYHAASEAYLAAHARVCGHPLPWEEHFDAACAARVRLDEARAALDALAAKGEG